MTSARASTAASRGKLFRHTSRTRRQASGTLIGLAITPASVIQAPRKASAGTSVAPGDRIPLYKRMLARQRKPERLFEKRAHLKLGILSRRCDKDHVELVAAQALEQNRGDFLGQHELQPGMALVKRRKNQGHEVGGKRRDRPDTQGPGEGIAMRPCMLC